MAELDESQFNVETRNALKSEFEKEFNVETSTPANYKTFIEYFRKRLGERSSHNRPALPIQVTPPTRGFDILLRTSARAIRLRFQLDNLYLIGYQKQNPQQWLEFDNTTKSHLISGSTFLGFDGSYKALANAAGQTLENITLGKQPLINAVNDLATSTVRKDRAKSLIIVIQMISESIRFIPISDRLNLTFLYPDGSKIATWMLNLEHYWGDLSEVLQRADAYPEQSFLIPSNIIIRIPFDLTSDVITNTNSKQLKTLADAASVLGIMLGFIFKRSASAVMAVNDGQFHLGRQLVEVFSVRINHINKGNLYGTITITDGLDLQYIYNRTKENPEPIKPGDNALLTRPTQSISAYGSFTIKALLKDEEDEEVSNGEIWWNVYNSTNEFDKPLFRNIDGKCGSVTVNYIVLSDAVATNIQVTLIKRDGKNPTDVYGQLIATNGNFRDYKSVLFQKASNEHIKVSPGQLIPLSKSAATVPLNSSFLVKANLYDHDMGSSDAEIANGIAEFPAQLSGTVEKSIFGKDGEIRVKVTWILYY